MSESLRRQISSPAALFVFEAAARLGSFGGAAVELNVTQPSISYQIKHLEKHLGIDLFVRRGRTVELTDDGLALFRAVQQGFHGIQITITEISHNYNANLVTLCLSSAAAAHLMLPRYPRLLEILPEIDLSLKIMSRDINPALESAEFAIRLGDGNWDDLEAHRLFDEVYFPVCAPGHFSSHEEISLEILRTSNLLYLKERFRDRDDWRVFFKELGAPLSHPRPRMIFSDQQTLLEAAIAGQGVALSWLGISEQFLGSGALVKPTTLEVRTNRAFYLVSPKGIKLSRAACDFRDFMVQEGFAIQLRWERQQS